MIELKTWLLGLEYFVDNEYLDLYCSLIYNNVGRKKERYVTQKHHVVPCSWYKIKYGVQRTYENRKIFDENNILVNLTYDLHILAHYYLTFCTSGALRKAMCNGLTHLLSANPSLKTSISKSDTQQLIENLDLLDIDAIYKEGRAHTEEWRKQHSEFMKAHNNQRGRMRSEEEKEHIRQVLKEKWRKSEIVLTEEQRVARSHKGKDNGMYGKHWVFITDGETTKKISPESTIPEGWKVGISNDWKTNVRKNAELKKDEQPHVYQFLLDGVSFVKEWKSAREAAETLKLASAANITACCKHKYNYYKGYVWRHKSEVEKENYSSSLI